MVWVIAHRGSSASAPENTIAAIEQAIADGADAIELDVQELADGTLAILHDLNLQRLAGVDHPSHELTVADLADLDVGRWFGPAFGAARIPTLAQVLAQVGDRVALNLELKVHGHERRLPEAVVALLGQFPRSRVVVTSFDWSMLQRVQTIAPHLPIGPIAAQPIDWAALAANLGPVAVVSLHHRLLDQAIVDRVKALPAALWVWTVDDPALAQGAIALGVDGLMTNCPQRYAQSSQS
ncbi:MAG: glycerophosphodiester phosphodiesterase [Oscillatoriales cyanobacterium]|nr:MAG: glycerophosphodiester phosphodiesterase [Oscillatoriales cyanobacterium]